MDTDRIIVQWILIYLTESLIVAEQYCQWQTFTAQCEQNQVIVMENALYGRMDSETCIENDFGHIGCQKDVILASDLKCSGRRSCSIKIPDETFDLNHDCPNDLRKYYDATYRCVNVIPGSRETCLQQNSILAPSGNGYISSLISDETGCGGTEAPWIIRAEVGQVIEVTLLDFALVNNTAITMARSPHCHVYVIFKEPLIGRSDTICGGRTRESWVFTTKSPQLEIRLVTGSPGKSKYFLLKYEVTGCTTLAAPSHGWIQKREQHVTMGCDYENVEWTMTCNQTTWIGERHNCSAVALIDDVDGPLAIPHTLSIVIIVGVAIIIGICILFMGLICLRRQRHREQSEVFHDFTDVTKTSVITCKSSYCDGKTSYQLEPLTNTTRICPTHPHGPSDDNDYGYVDELTKVTGIPRLPRGGPGVRGVGTGAGPVFMPTCTIRCARTCGPDAAQQLYTTAAGTTAVTNQLCGGHTPGVPDLYATPTRDPSTCVHCAECAKVRYVGVDSPTITPVGPYEKAPVELIAADHMSMSPINTRRTKSEEDVYAKAIRPSDRKTCDSTNQHNPQREKTCSPVLYRRN